jgi:hypothetical protein
LKDQGKLKPDTELLMTKSCFFLWKIFLNPGQGNSALGSAALAPEPFFPGAAPTTGIAILDLLACLP